MDHTVWTLQARAKPFQRFNSLALDLPAHGRSGGSPCESIDEFARVVLQFLDDMGAHRCAIVGHSMGSLVALKVAAGHPDRVTHLALLGTALRMPVHSGLLQAASEDLPRAAAMIADWGLGARARVSGSGTPGISLPMTARALLERSRPGVLAADLAACNRYADGSAHAGAVRCPGLVICGRQDRMTPAKQGERLAALIAASRTVQLSTGHMMMLEDPRVVLQALTPFLLEA
jgi:pimeloyl-ACP methyl ester carboxylesterase